MSEATDIAADLLADGQAMTISRTTRGTYDPVYGDFSSSTSQSWTVNGITKAYNLFGTGVVVAAENSLVQAGDIQAVIDAVTVTPQPGDVVAIMGESWNVLTVDPVAPQGEALMFKLHLRR